MPDVIVIDTDVPFDPAQWICAGKVYKDVPTEVFNAYDDARIIPLALAATLPNNAVPVTEFLAVKLPGILRNTKKLPSQTEHWFSPDLPNCDPATLWSLNSIPPLFFLMELEEDFPQKWLNGAKSILDPLNNSLRLPLCALAFYREIHRPQTAQEKWANSVEWARDEVPGSNPERGSGG
ncbi:hypothetical protein DFH09DRAFT_1335265 [Mycena vulgaris]|nr:hypothetical protein DFH09DRAFT_1335265 [Mycena vulgaris]